MKAIVHERYGRPDVLELREVERPVIEDDQVLVRVHAVIRQSRRVVRRDRAVVRTNRKRAAGARRRLRWEAI